MSETTWQKRWMLDFDSCLGDLQGHMCRSVYEASGEIIHVDDIDDWGWWDGHPMEHFVWGESCFQNREWTVQMPILKGVRGALHALKQRGDDMAIVSDRYDYMKPWIEEWADINGIDVPVYVTNKTESKLDIAHRLGLNTVVEDSPHWIYMFQEYGFVETVYVMDYAYNRGFESKGPIKRVQSWSHLKSKEIVHHG